MRTGRLSLAKGRASDRRETAAAYLMKLATIKEFRDGATKFLRSCDPVLTTRRGKPTGIYVALEEGEGLPLDFRAQVLSTLNRARQAEPGEPRCDRKGDSEGS